MDDLFEENLSTFETKAEDEFLVNPSIVESISSLFQKLMACMWLLSIKWILKILYT